MTDLVPADSIEQIVGRRRHRADHPEGEAMTDKPIQAPLDLETS